ncbi:MAG: hypothetical protein NC081_02310 [Roseburia sp.]|nr:hypothetical protein [Roseburia sp.]
MLTLGKILLILLGIIIAFLLLLLFFPIGYKVYLNRTAEEFTVRLRASWLFGLLRFCYSYPEPGDFRVKLAFFTLYSSSGSGRDKETHKKAGKDKARQKKRRGKKAEQAKEETGEKKENRKEANPGGVRQDSETPKSEKMQGQQREASKDESTSDSAKTLSGEEQKLSKLEKIKYTIQKIYDKIKDIFENITFYTELLQQKDTRGLLGHAGRRFGRIMRHIRPRSLQAELLIGTGSPDTTGYLLAVYSILLPWMGRPENIRLTADFEQAVFRGRVRARGFVMVFRLLSNGVLLILDKRIGRIYEKIKKHGAEKNIKFNVQRTG